MGYVTEPLPLALPCHEDLAQLARADPLAYEVLRREIIENFIASAPERLRPRLRGIQFRIDGVRRLSRTALGSTVKIYELMWNSFLTLNDSLQTLVQSKDELSSNQGATESNENRPGKSAQIIRFPPGKTLHCKTNSK